MDTSSSVHVNKGKDILILGKAPTQGLGKHSLSAEKIYSINFTRINTKFCLSLHYHGAKSYLFVNGTEIHKFKAKDPEIVPNNLFLGNASKDFSASNMKKTEFNGHICDFSVDYDAINNISDIHKYLMKKMTCKMFGFVKQIFISAMVFFGCNLSNENSFKCISMNNKKCKARPQIVNVNSKELVFFF